MRFVEKSESSGLEMVEDEPLETDFRCFGLGVVGSALAGVGSGLGDSGGEIALGVMAEVEMGFGGWRSLEEGFADSLEYAAWPGVWC